MSEYIDRFSALSKWQLVKAAALSAMGYVIFMALGLLLGWSVNLSDVLPLYGLFVLDEMGYRINRHPQPFMIAGAILLVLAELIGSVVI